MSDEPQEDEGRPKFADVLKAFTPPGTDFEAFKESMSAQGAPARISPEAILAANAAGFPLPPSASGTRCVRCEHPHGGAPGRVCLYAEAHLGRSPHRRSPDLELDAVSRPGQPVIPADPFARPASMAAIAAHEMFGDFLGGGFSEDQALRLVAYMIRSGGEDTNQGG